MASIVFWNWLQQWKYLFSDPCHYLNTYVLIILIIMYWWWLALVAQWLETDIIIPYFLIIPWLGCKKQYYSVVIDTGPYCRTPRLNHTYYCLCKVWSQLVHLTFYCLQTPLKNVFCILVRESSYQNEIQWVDSNILCHCCSYTVFQTVCIWQCSTINR